MPSDRDIADLRERTRKLAITVNKNENEIAEMKDAIQSQVDIVFDRNRDLERRLMVAEKKLAFSPQDLQKYTTLARAFSIVFLSIVAGTMPFVILQLQFQAAREHLTLALEPLLISTILGLLATAGYFAFGRKVPTNSKELLSDATDAVIGHIGPDKEAKEDAST